MRRVNQGTHSPSQTPGLASIIWASVAKRDQRPDWSVKCSVTVSPECISKFNELKLGKSIKYIIYKLSDDYKEIVVEDSSSDPDWETFQNKLMNAQAGHKGKTGKGPRYAVYDFQYELEGGEGTR